jgi:peptide/nickel transport system substrate-binding protein
MLGKGAAPEPNQSIEPTKVEASMTFFRSIAGAAVLAVALAGAGLSEAKTLKMAYDADPVSLDPHEQLSGGTLQLSHMLFDPLVRWTKDLGFEGRIAESWERLDSTTVRFKLRQGVKFHSGNTLTAADVKWTFDRLKSSPDFKGPYRRYRHRRAVPAGAAQRHLHLPDGC